MQYAYLFEAHTIQAYILDSGKLSEMVGASKILEELIGKRGPLDTVLTELFLPESLSLDNNDEFTINTHFSFARRGGGAFFLLFSDPEKAQQLKKVWSLVVSGLAPGLAYAHACSDKPSSQYEAIESAKKILHQQRNHLNAELPEATPWLR